MGFHKIETFPFSKIPRNLLANKTQVTPLRAPGLNLQRHYMQHHAHWRSIWFCPIPGCPCSLSSKEGLVRHLQSRQHARGIKLNLVRRVAKQIANQNCFWPVNQTMAEKLLRASKRIFRYVALYSMAGVAMESRLFRILPIRRHAFHGCLRSIPNTKDEL